MSEIPQEGATRTFGEGRKLGGREGKHDEEGLLFSLEGLAISAKSALDGGNVERAKQQLEDLLKGIEDRRKVLNGGSIPEERKHEEEQTPS